MSSMVGLASARAEPFDHLFVLVRFTKSFAMISGLIKVFNRVQTVQLSILFVSAALLRANNTHLLQVYIDRGSLLLYQVFFNELDDTFKT